MSDQEVFEELSNSIKNLKKRCRDEGTSEEDFKKMYYQSLKSLENTGPRESRHNSTPRIITKYRIILVGFIIALCAIYNYKIIYSCIVCNLQDYIYPGLKLLRRISIPIISLFPSLTGYYHETCIIQNPFFTVADMDCWPCSTVSNIREVPDSLPVSQQHSTPFIYQTNQEVVNVDKLKELYIRNINVFNKESPKILTNNKYYTSPHNLFLTDELLHDKNFYIWKFNSMDAAKLLRKIIPRPKVVPKFGQSTERFLIVDTSQKSFYIPDTECNFSFLLGLSGSREIHLVPAEECKHQCKSLKVEMRETYLLWYNWWYWRPMAQSSLGNNTFIAHVGSYC